MKRFKKMMAIAIVAMMTLMYVVPSMAATNNLTLDGKIEIQSLESGDTVNFYQILEFSQDATTTGGWVAKAPFSSVLDTPEKIQKVLGLGTDGKPLPATTIEAATPGTYGISSTLAGQLAQCVTSTTTATYANVSESDGTAKVESPAAGLYLALVSPGQSGTMYNPVFVGADYVQTTPPTSSNIWIVDMEDSYSDTAMAKKSQVTLEKSADTTIVDDEEEEVNEGVELDESSSTVGSGEIVQFFVNTTVPVFASNYTSPVFKVTDEMSTGLEYQTGTITVYKGTYTNQEDLLEALDEVDEGDSLEIARTNYTVNPETTKGYTLSFKNGTDEYLKTLTTPQKITIVYNAKVTSDAPKSINILDNTVRVNYSNNPSDTEGYGVLKDKTEHYTFDIDGELWGQPENTPPWSTVEVIKIGKDKNGKEITKSVVTYHEGSGTNQSAGALEGAEFELYILDDRSSTTIKDENGSDIKVTKYTNDILTSSKKIVSGSDGRLTIQGESIPGIRGLDAGVYYLKETKAPDGYIKSQNAVKIEIIPTMKSSATKVTEYYDKSDQKFYSAQDSEKTRIKVEYEYYELESYKVKINGVETANYTIDISTSAINKGDNVVGTPAKSTAGKIDNTQGVELPSTGGMGTTLFYIIGAILIIGAGVLLVTRRRTESAE